MSETTILQEERNCWRIEHADRASMLVDGCDYFHAFRETAKKAQRSILIIGWDINSHFKLERPDPDDGLPIRLDEFLDNLVRHRSRLQVHILNWDYAAILAADREWLASYKLDWKTHRRLHYRLDSHHPAGASQHQKIVVVDDRVAFSGGLDFTLGRWDTSAHQPDDPRRRDNDKSIPQPYHDVQLMVSGKAAAALGELARSRWYKATKQRLEAPSSPAKHDPWPAEITPELSDVEVGIARTYPEYGNQQEVREVEQLLVDAIAAARSMIYIENQYFTARKIGAALLERLREDDAPEVVVILPQHTVGWLSQYTMDVLRERLIKRLQQADRHKRLRIYYPHIPGLDGDCVNVHAKILVIDDTLIRVGSANFNNRSMGLDSECDLAIEARGETRTVQGIAQLRNRLLGEHLDVTPQTVTKTLAEQGSLIRTIEALTGSGRCLKRYEYKVSEDLDRLVPDEQIADPERPIDGEEIADQFISEEDKPSVRSTLATLASILVFALLLAASWRWGPLGEWLDIGALLARLAELRGSWLALVTMLAVYVIGGLIIFPVTVMIAATGLVFGAFYGFIYALLGAVLSALVTYAVGQSLGHRTLRRLSHRWVGRVSQRLAQQGLLAIITLRVVPVAPFSVINLVAGASHIRFRDFALGTLFGMTPGILALTFFSDQVVSAIKTPVTIRIVGLLSVAAVIAIGTWALSRWLLQRQKQGQEQKR